LIAQLNYIYLRQIISSSFKKLFPFGLAISLIIPSFRHFRPSFRQIICFEDVSFDGRAIVYILRTQPGSLDFGTKRMPRFSQNTNRGNRKSQIVCRIKNPFYGFLYSSALHRVNETSSAGERFSASTKIHANVQVSSDTNTETKTWKPFSSTRMSLALQSVRPVIFMPRV